MTNHWANFTNFTNFTMRIGQTAQHTTVIFNTLLYEESHHDVCEAAWRRGMRNAADRVKIKAQVQHTSVRFGPRVPEAPIWTQPNAKPHRPIVTAQ